MSKETKNALPPHLMELLHPTPSGTAKLVAAWDGLCIESQIQILITLDEAGFPKYLDHKVRHKALDSSNAYVRYLAGKKFYFYDDDNEEEQDIIARIEMDPDPLVKYCLLESEYGLGVDFESELFFSLPQEARLAKVRDLSDSGEAIASLIAFAVDNYLEEGKVTEIELHEILTDYLNKPSFHEHYGEDQWRSRCDGYGEFLAGKDVEALWALVVKIPERISHVLIKYLPEQAGLSSGIPENILGQLTPEQLATLLYRRDIALKDLRKKIFREPAESLDRVRSAAISCNFDLSYDDFSEILKKSDNEKIDILRDLAVMAGDLSLVFYDALHDILSTVDNPLGAWDDAGMAEIAFARNAKNLTGWQREKQMRELRLFRFAKQAVPWKSTEEGYPPRDELEFLGDLSVDGDTWATFKNFSNEWNKRLWNTKKLEKYLPRIYEVGEKDIEETFDNGTGIYKDAVGRVERKVDSILTSVSTDDDDEDSFTETLDELIEHSMSFQERTSESIEGIKNEMGQLRSVLGRQKILLYLVIGLWALLLIVKH